MKEQLGIKAGEVVKREEAKAQKSAYIHILESIIEGVLLFSRPGRVRARRR